MATIVFFPEGAHGPTNNCAGIGAVLRERGHRVVFIVEESFAGTLEVRGFEERLMRLGPPPEQEEAPGQFWIDFIHETAPVFRKPTIEQLGEFVAPTFEALCDGARYVHPRLLEIIDPTMRCASALQQMAQRLQARSGTVAAAGLIERLAS
jgi:UDP:flavonoid glycosyltransferase YjiC (YdhE family)